MLVCCNNWNSKPKNGPCMIIIKNSCKNKYKHENKQNFNLKLQGHKEFCTLYVLVYALLLSTSFSSFRGITHFTLIIIKHYNF